MLDLFTIFTRGGIVLWSFQPPASTMSGDPINGFIQDSLIEGRILSDETFVYNKTHCVSYKLDNARDLVAAAVYSKVIEGNAAYVPHLINAAYNAFVKEYQDQLASNLYREYDFGALFDRLYLKAKEKYGDQVQPQIAKRTQNDEESPEEAEEEGSDHLEDDQEAQEEQENAAQGMTDKARKRLEALRSGKKGNTRKSPKKQPSVEAPAKPKPLSQAPKFVDYSEPQKGEAEDHFTSDQLSRYREESAMMQGTMADLEFDDLEGEQDVEGDKPKAKGLFSFFSNLAGGVISREDLDPVMKKMHLHLVDKNVAANISEKLCAAVADKLVGTTRGSFQGIASVVKDTLSDTLTQILTPKRQVDILRDIQTNKTKTKTPYVTVFCGVNGVGKSTNLSKIAFWLLSNNLRVLIAACDTFRSGAVEQLRTHCRKLRKLLELENTEKPILEIFDQGYGKDDASVAAHAISYAAHEGFDVVLVDTAGRMQNNEPLMRSLANLIQTNDPNLLLFVGEALVGNEAVDQLTNFNKALMDFSTASHPRTIDGIVLTKFDTVDDKVGSSISMTYTTGKPIVFVGTGQDYPDLKRLNVKSVVQALLK